MRLSFHGADRTVTGSCHLIETAGKKILIDCGVYQGDAAMEAANRGDFGFDPASIDMLILTHAHLDHCGRIPLLVKRGFRGEIIATPPTRELARLVMLDSARLQEEDTRRELRKAARWTPATPAEEPLYGLNDALRAVDFFGRLVRYGTVELAPNITATFTDAGHILGSASVLITARENGGVKRIAMSGDIGNAGRPLLNDPVAPAAADAVVMESTYGDRDHKPMEQSLKEFYEALGAIRARGGNAVIPAFALDRTQELLFFIKKGVLENKLPPDLQVFVDSPMAISATDITRRSPDFLAPSIAAALREGDDPFAPPRLRFTKLAADSMEINNIRSGAVIIAGSGMATGGRVLHHLLRNLDRPECGVVIVGFAAAGTLARRIVDGEKHVSILGQDVRVRAQIYTINGFSGHAGRSELIAWRKTVEAPLTFLTHGEAAVMQKLASALPGQTRMPALGETVEI
ncbi:MAG: MBL fold metallo-hydrolase [Hyphomicrobiales bacterium]|nr:MBL fold metallo-hydrolase [Hyphomicrobiales bacterium]